jgi:exodeoxyribonuclease V alpha subunit
MEELQGYVDHIIFRNGDNGYTVFNFISDEDEVTCVGIFPVVTEGEILLLHGSFETHPSYGEQFHVRSFETKAPEDAVSMERYLASGAIKGIGVTLASRIVRRFGKDTFRIMEEEPERLSEVKGISERMAREITDQMMEKRDLRDAMVFLGNYGISTNLAIKIYQAYGARVYSVIRENPYQMAEDVTGVGFKIADEIASKVGIQTDSDFRVQSGILYCLAQGAGQGHTYLPREILLQYAKELLGVETEHIESHIMNLAMARKIMVKKDAIYARSFYHMEETAAGMLHALDVTYEMSAAELTQVLHRIQKEEDLQLDEGQEEAVRQAATHGLFILTGGPGTGKTTTIRALISFFEQQGMDIFLAAPTGRAAKRMSETTGYEARTIHRMLEVNGAMSEEGGGSGGMFERNEQNPLEADVIIIDEMSMVDIGLLYALLKAVPPGCRLILVGDVNQLPSVGPGNVLRDLIESECFSTVTLHKIFRQAAQSDIITNAHKINRGEHVAADNKSRDFFFLRRDDADVIINVMLQLVGQKLPKYVGATRYDIQVLTPTRKGLLGVERLNAILQKYLNPPDPGKKEHTVGDRIFREGDKVMQIRNNYQLAWEIRSNYGLTVDQGLGVFNGDVGVIREINDYTNSLTVVYDEGRSVEYPFKNTDELELAYAITIHKSQGSEYPAAVIPLLPGPRMLMNRNLLYTAVTRARKCITIVGDEQTFYQMIDNSMQQRRYSGLKERLLESVEPIM